VNNAVFNEVQKLAVLCVGSRRSLGRAFKALGPATEKALIHGPTDIYLLRKIIVNSLKHTSEKAGQQSMYKRRLEKVEFKSMFSFDL